MLFLHVTSHSGRLGQHYVVICTKTESPIPEKKEQCLQKPKQTPRALATPSSLTMPAKNLEAEPETEIENKLLSGMRLLLSINAQYLTQINQISFLKVRPKECTNSTIFELATLGALKTKTASQNHSLKTNPLKRAIDTETSKAQEDNNYSMQKKEKDRPESIIQDFEHDTICYTGVFEQQQAAGGAMLS
ncbi:hypothetical protein G9A89_019355 [Geosiphon pyriformis]|nr:hypothetical protein G9A89_019355 [Geosiphon pyriformis]